MVGSALKWLATPSPSVSITGMRLIIIFSCFLCSVHSKESQKVRLEIEPAALQADPGPEVIYGKRKGRSARKFLYPEITLSGKAQTFRLYFNQTSTNRYHYLDRSASQLVLGQHIDGIETVLTKVNISKAGITGTQALRVCVRIGCVGVFQGKRLVAWAYHDQILPGTVGLRRHGHAKAQSIKLDVTERDEISFSDDFMRKENASYAWRTSVSGGKGGSFAVKSLRNPLLSANAFCYMGEGERVLSVTGNQWWDNYSYAVSLRGPKKGKVGLVFGYQDEKNYGLFRWSARPIMDDGSTVGAGVRELIRIVDGKEHVIRELSGGYIPDQWYRIEILNTYSGLRLKVDGYDLFEECQPGLVAGLVGVWCDIKRPRFRTQDPNHLPYEQNSMAHLMVQYAVFDDIQVESTSDVLEDFRTPGKLSSGWVSGHGHWNVASGAGNSGAGELQVAAADHASKSLLGKSSWRGYRVSVDVDPSQRAAGIIFMYRDESNYLSGVIDGQQLKLICMANGEERILDSAPIGILPEGKQDLSHLEIRSQDGHVRLSWSGNKTFTAARRPVVTVEGWVGQKADRGRAGLWVAAAKRDTPVRFRRFRVGFERTQPPLASRNAVFAFEEGKMSKWTDPKRDWFSWPDSSLDGKERITPRWRQGLYAGDVEAVVEVREILEEQHSISVALASDFKKFFGGYVLTYRSDPTSRARQGTLTLLRAGKVIAEKSIPKQKDRAISSVALRRAGKFLLGKVNGKALLMASEVRPLPVSRVGYHAGGVEARTEATRVISAGIQGAQFSRAPVFWRTGGAAIFEIANRWQCDSRWTFACLGNDRWRGQAAVLWNKKVWPGDVSVELFVGNRMDRSRGTQYNYARDINVTICSDGQDLTKGYTFMFGGKGNKGSMILRNGIEVKREPKVTIPVNMQFHQHWFVIRIEKQGGRLTYKVDRYFDDKKDRAMTFVDPNPLKGSRIAIWTYDHALVLSKIRISGGNETGIEHPLLDVARLKTIYSDNEQKISAITPKAGRR